MDMLDAFVLLLVIYIAILFPLAGFLCEYVWPWAKQLWKDWRAFRTERRRARKRDEYKQWKERKKCTNK